MQPILTRVIKTEFPAGRRVIAVSDVHAHGSHLKQLLEKISFSQDDILVIVGDILCRGTESLATLRYVMQLAETYTVYPLIGNVDEWGLTTALTLDADTLCRNTQVQIDWHGGCLYSEMAAEVGMALTPDMDIVTFRTSVRSKLAKEYAFMASLATILQTPDYTFVHGGIPAQPVETLEGTLARTLTKRDAYIDEGIYNDRWTVVGHWPVPLYAGSVMQFSPVVNAAQRIISIDGGCGLKREGQLNALIIDGGKHFWQSYDELPTAIALDPQAPSERSHCITFMNGDVDILAEEGDLTHVLHKGPNHKMWVPSGHIFYQDGKPRCSDTTDYHLPVTPGDLLHVVWETSRGAVCKKNGVEGWYTGRLSPIGHTDAEARERAEGPYPLPM